MAALEGQRVIDELCEVPNNFYVNEICVQQNLFRIYRPLVTS